MEFHYVIAFNDKTKKWSIEDETKYLDGNIWITDDDDVDDMEKNEWAWASGAYQELVDQRCRNMLNALVTIWPEVDTNDY